MSETRLRVDIPFVPDNEPLVIMSLVAGIRQQVYKPVERRELATNQEFPAWLESPDEVHPAERAYKRVQRTLGYVCWSPDPATDMDSLGYQLEMVARQTVALPSLIKEWAQYVECSELVVVCWFEDEQFVREATYKFETWTGWKITLVSGPDAAVWGIPVKVSA